MGLLGVDSDLSSRFALSYPSLLFFDRCIVLRLVEIGMNVLIESASVATRMKV